MTLLLIGIIIVLVLLVGLVIWRLRRAKAYLVSSNGIYVGVNPDRTLKPVLRVNAIHFYIIVAKSDSACLFEHTFVTTPTKAAANRKTHALRMNLTTSIGGKMFGFISPLNLLLHDVPPSLHLQKHGDGFILSDRSDRILTITAKTISFSASGSILEFESV
jgi:hypothetical protein